MAECRAVTREVSDCGDRGAVFVGELGDDEFLVARAVGVDPKDDASVAG